MTPADVLAFWRASEKDWFSHDAAFDAAFSARFGDAHFAAARGELSAWESTADGALALLLLLDQFPRNAFRGTAHAFATDPLAQGVTERAIDAGLDRAIEPKLRLFFYLPFQHAEDVGLQSRAVALTEALGDANNTRYAILHRDIIARFERFPHRNACLGRASTPEEIAFLAGGGFKG